MVWLRTGAESDRQGRFQLADGGTILLDEIGEMPNHLQVRLLTVLQRREVTPLGAEEIVPIDVRVIAATNRNVDEDLASGRLREDLYYRLNVVTLHVPPLRKRLEDLPDLIGRFLRHFRSTMDRPEVGSISPDALDALLDYSWPGNVRELINVVERALLVSQSSQITIDDLPKRVVTESAEPRRGGHQPTEIDEATVVPADWYARPLKEARKLAVAQFEKAYLHRVLTEASGKIGETAKRAGVTTRALYDKMRRHGLKKENYF